MKKSTLRLVDLVDKLDDTAAVVAFLGEVMGYRRDDLPLSVKAAEGLASVLGDIQRAIEDVSREMDSLRNVEEGQFPALSGVPASMRPVPRAEASEGQGARF